jgi:hypothetical protein
MASRTRTAKASSASSAISVPLAQRKAVTSSLTVRKPPVDLQRKTRAMMLRVMSCRTPVRAMGSMSRPVSSRVSRLAADRIARLLWQDSGDGHKRHGDS